MSTGATVLLVLVIAVIVVAAGLFAAMFRRDDAVLGLAGLTATMTAAMAAVIYAGVDSG
jgi:hypothetical protein